MPGFYPRANDPCSPVSATNPFADKGATFQKQFSWRNGLPRIAVVQGVPVTQPAPGVPVVQSMPPVPQQMDRPERRSGDSPARFRVVAGSPAHLPPPGARASIRRQNTAWQRHNAKTERCMCCASLLSCGLDGLLFSEDNLSLIHI